MAESLSIHYIISQIGWRTGSGDRVLGKVFTILMFLTVYRLTLMGGCDIISQQSGKKCRIVLLLSK